MPAQYGATTEGEEAIASATAEVLLAVLGATTVKAVLTEWGCSFDSATSSDAPVVVQLCQVSTSTNGTGATETKPGRGAPTAQCTAFHSFSADPTVGDTIWYDEVPPQGGNVHVQYPLGREPVISDGSTSQGLAIRATAPTGCNAVANMWWEE